MVLKMRSLGILLLALCIQGCPARGIYDDLEEIDLWGRGVPGTATSEKFAPDCIKDILIVWDNSYSVGIGPFLDVIRPFIINLIKSPSLNVQKHGTNIGVLTFSTQANTRLLWNVNDYPNEEELLAKINEMDYNNLMGDGTRTGIALMEANKLFADKSPYNYRPNVDDVVFLFTDGQPNRRLRAPEYEDSFGFHSETEMASHFAEELRKKNVTVVGLATGQNGIINRFYEDLVSWSTYVFRTELTELDEVLDKIVAASCRSAGQCGCDETLIQEYTKRGRGAVVDWPEPILECTSRNPDVSKTTVTPQGSKSGKTFEKGQHEIVYSFTYQDGGKLRTHECKVSIEVLDCECRHKQTVNGVIGPNESKGLVRWTTPKPSCPAVLKKPAGDPKGFFSEGEHTVRYVYTYKSGSNDFEMSCDVDINMKSCRCPSVQTFKAMSGANRKAFVTWKEPTPSCEVTLVSSDNASPEGYFNVGEHVRKYTYRHESGFKMTCDVVIKVEACECPAQQTVFGVIGPGEMKGRAKWKIPVPSCPAQLNQPESAGEGLFSEGEHEVPYHYTHTSGRNTFDMTCDVKIRMKACRCPPEKKIIKTLEYGKSEAFVSWKEPTPNCDVTLESSDSALPEGYFTVGKHTRKYRYRHEEGFELSCGVSIEVEGKLCHGRAFDFNSEVCCCGQVHSAERGYSCCGIEYFDESTHICCDEKRANIMPKEKRCPLQSP